MTMPRVLRLLAKRHRDLGRQKNKTACRIHALLLDLTHGGVSAQITVSRANAVLDTIDAPDAISRDRVEPGRELVADMTRHESLMKASKQRIKSAVAASGTTLTEIYGCGPICAAMIIGHTGNIERPVLADLHATLPQPVGRTIKEGRESPDHDRRGTDPAGLATRRYP